jgi:hypothetical protein
MLIELFELARLVWRYIVVPLEQLVCSSSRTVKVKRRQLI